MDTPDDVLPALPTPPALNVAPTVKSRRGDVLATYLIAWVALGVGGIALWCNLTTDTTSRLGTDTLQALHSEIDATHRRIEQANRDREALRQRLADAEGVNKSLREEVLGVIERARVLEGAVTNLAEKRLSGRDALLLNEAEMLLLLSKERFELFSDPQTALAGYRLADSALAAVDDPSFVTVRETLSLEQNALTSLREPSVAAGIAELERLRDQLDGFPVITSTETAQEASRLRRLLSQFVRVSHDAAPIASRDRALGRALLVLDLRVAEAALLARDLVTFRASITRIQNVLIQQYDPNAPTVRAAHTALSRLSSADAPPPPELGAALKELRNLRSIHTLGETASTKAAAP